MAARVNGELWDLHRPLPAGAVVEPVRSKARRAEYPAALRRARRRPGRPVPAPRGQAGHRTADHRRLLLRLRPGRALHPDDLRELEKAMTRSSRSGSASGVGRSPTTRRGRARPRAVQAGAHRRQGRRRGRRWRERGSKRGRTDHLRQLRRDDSVAWKDLCRGPHYPIPATFRPSPLPGIPPRTGAATRASRSCSDCTAPPGQAGMR